MKKTLCIAGTALLMVAGVAQAESILADLSDVSVINTAAGPDPAGLKVVRPSEKTLKIGRYRDAADAPNGSNAAAVFAFLLPDFGAVNNPFSTATFTFNVAEKTGRWNLCLEGLGIRSVPTVSPYDFHHARAYGATESILLQDRILTATSPVGSYTSSDLAAYLNKQYAGGANAGKFVFLRLAVSLPAASDIYDTNNGYDITSADAASKQPQINYTTTSAVTASKPPQTNQAVTSAAVVSKPPQPNQTVTPAVAASKQPPVSQTVTSAVAASKQPQTNRTVASAVVASKPPQTNQTVTPVAAASKKPQINHAVTPKSGVVGMTGLGVVIVLLLRKSERC